MKDSLKILFVINPGSGGKNKRDWEPAIREHFSALDIAIDCFILKGGDDTEALKKKIRQTEPEKVVAVGGDGTVSVVARLLLHTSMALGILPAGSANGMAKELQLPQDMPSAMNLLLDGDIKNADVIRINKKHICLHLSDLGLNAKLIKYFEEANHRGKLGYARVALKTLWRKTSIRTHITTDQGEFSKGAFMVALANATKYGTGAVINPLGDLYDGLFEVVIIRKLALVEIVKMLFRPRPFDPENIQIVQTSKVLIRTSRKTHFQVDGEYLGKTDYVEAHILPGSLKLIVPGKIQ